MPILLSQGAAEAMKKDAAKGTTVQYSTIEQAWYTVDANGKRHYLSYILMTDGERAEAHRVRGY